MKAHFEACGCAMSVGESRESEERMLSLGREPACPAEAASLVVSSNCVVVPETYGLGARCDVRVDDATSTYLMGRRRT